MPQLYCAKQNSIEFCDPVLRMIPVLSDLSVLLTLMLCTTLAAQTQDITPTATSMSLFQTYFNDTFIRKIKANWDPKLKAYASKG